MPEQLTISDRRLNAARVFGANTIAFIGQLAIDMPAGYFGPADHVTQAGAIYSSILALTTVIAVGALFFNKSWVTRLLPLIFSLNIGIFVAGLATSPVIAGLVVTWNLVALLWFLFPLGNFSSGRKKQSVGMHIHERFADSSAAIRHLIIVSLMLSIAVVGYELSGLFVTQLITLFVDLATIVFTAPLLLYLYRCRQRLLMLLLAPLIISVFLVGYPTAFFSVLALYQAIVLTVFLTQGPLFDDLLEYFYEYPALLVLSTFALLTGIGTLLLSFPAASATGVAVSPLDAFFTATSAACITGLIVLDTPVAFSPFGHVVIFSLFQLGGLGILVLSTFATLLLGSRLGLRAERALEEAMDIRGARNAYELTQFIVIATLLIEFIGGIILSARFWAHGMAVPDALWRGFFHAVSAFCHAGFALQSDSLMMFQEDPVALITVSILITLGGIGFFVLAGTWHWLQGRQRRVGFPVKVVVWATVVLVVLGTFLFLMVEWNGTLSQLSGFDKVVNALFQSVTLRSAGFNSVDATAFAPATILFMLIFMFIGGAPGSTAGGIKITTFVILLAAVRAISRGEPRVVLFKRYIPQRLVYRSAAIAVISMGVVLLLLFVLLLTQPIPFEILAFEAVSAMGTVGLSMGATSQLNSIGKLLVIAVIFMGRVGPLALALVLGQGKTSRLSYPEGKIMVG